MLWPRELMMGVSIPPEAGFGILLVVLALVAIAGVWLLARGWRRSEHVPKWTPRGQARVETITVMTSDGMSPENVQRLLARHDIGCWGWTQNGREATFTVPGHAMVRAVKLLREAGLEIGAAGGLRKARPDDEGGDELVAGRGRRTGNAPDKPIRIRQ